MSICNRTLFGRWSAQALHICLSACLLQMGLAAPGSDAHGQEDRELQQVLKKMDEVAKSFRAFTARFSQKKYTAVLKEFDTPDTGEFYYSFAKDGSALMRHEITSPGKRILTIKGDVATVYQPVIKQAQIYNLGKQKDLVEYLALGIGQRTAKLQDKFNITYQGSESVNGVPCSILVFKPKDPKAAARLESITIWLNKTSEVPIQYKFEEPSGYYLQVNFLEEKLNVKIPDSKFEQKLPKGVEIQRIQ
jgi:outer membrane lipoprotein-sorting protein